MNILEVELTLFTAGVIFPYQFFLFLKKKKKLFLLNSSKTQNIFLQGKKAEQLYDSTKPHAPWATSMSAEEKAGLVEAELRSRR